MRNISFMLTTEQIRNQTKTVTRRINWTKLKVGDRLQGCVKCMGLKPGQKIEKLAVIEVVDVRREKLSKMKRRPAYGDAEAVKEGFPELSGAEFVRFFCSEMKVKPSIIVTRIEFKYVP